MTRNDASGSACSSSRSTPTTTPSARAAAAAEDLGADVVFNWDHFYPLYGEPDGKHFECWTMLGAWAESTSRVEIGALVTCNSYRNPELLADMARTVDHISGGRLILGIGSGWFERDYDEYGYEFGTAGGRLDDLGRVAAAHRGAAGQAEPGADPQDPGPDRRRRREEDAASWSRKHADIWHGFGDPEDVERKVEDPRPSTAPTSAATRPRSSARVGVQGEPGRAGPEAAGRLGVTTVHGRRRRPGLRPGRARAWIAWRDKTNG